MSLMGFVLLIGRCMQTSISLKVSLVVTTSCHEHYCELMILVVLLPVDVLLEVGFACRTASLGVGRRGLDVVVVRKEIIVVLRVECGGAGLRRRRLRWRGGNVDWPSSGR